MDFSFSDEKINIAIIAPGEISGILAKGIEKKFSEYMPKAFVSLFSKDFASFMEDIMNNDLVIFICAAGIAVRYIAPFVESKKNDPAVLVIDEGKRFCISLLSGHWGRANDFANTLSEWIDTVPVVTTATDGRGKIAADSFARNNNLYISDWKAVKEASVGILSGNSYEIIVSHNDIPDSMLPLENKVRLYVKDIIIGVGCKKGTEADEIKEAVRDVLLKYNISEKSIAAVSSIDLKKNEEGIISLAKAYDCKFLTFSASEINKACSLYPKTLFSSSDFVKETTGVDCVCEMSLFAAGAKKILVSKQKYNGITLSVGML